MIGFSRRFNCIGEDSAIFELILPQKSDKDTFPSICNEGMSQPEEIGTSQYRVLQLGSFGVEPVTGYLAPN